VTGTPGYHDLPRPEVVPFLPAHPRRVLEVGCGAGTFRQHLAEPNEYWGIEPDQGAAEAARSRLDRVLHGSFEEVESTLPAGHFDLVIANDVIEHMADPDRFLARIKTALAPGGVLVGSVPNVRFVVHLFEVLVKKDWEYKSEGILDRTHLRFFTEKSLRRLLAGHGFALERFGGINPAVTTPLTPKFLVKRLIIALLGADTAYLQFAFRARPETSPRP
jgi:SAM-dependent methyltransferase